MNDLRYIRKRFRCHNCYTKFSKLVGYEDDKAKCDKCGNISFTMSEDDFLRQTRSNIDKEYAMVFENNKKREEEKTNTNNRHNNRYQNNNQRQSNACNNDNNARMNYNERARSFQRNQDRQYNNNRNNQNQYSNYNVNNEHNNQRGNRNNNMNTGDFADFLGFIGSDIINNNNNRRNNSNSNYSRGRGNNFENIVIRFNNNPSITIHEFGEDVYDPIFMIFGSTFNDIFRNNFSSNFRSNFVNNDFASIIEQSLRQSQNNRKPPASKEAVQKLKKFKMSDKYCKKNEKGLLEQPSCCICISEIKKNEDTLLLPCGHMFHSNCIMDWLKQNNTCPVCRFELPTN